tara:strand:- start:32 stop:217 length:186 start_codon:yes stop_codon:yes gene_type:complete
MSTKTDYTTTLITLAGVATLMDAISIQLEVTTGERNDRFDAIRCAIEDFREDLSDSAEVTA